MSHGEDERVLLIRQKLRAGDLPTAMHTKTWFGRGSGEVCDACQRGVDAADVEVEIDFEPGPSLRLHAACFQFWQVEAHGKG